jgi:peptide deformylase
MALLKMRYLPDEVLRQKAKKVPSIDKYIQKLIEDMIETMHENNGAGLAAPQVGVSLRLVVIQMPEGEPIVLINPEIAKRFGSRELVEGCLSVPGYSGEMVRSEKVIVKGLDRHGRKIRIKAEGLMAQAIEHEMDHLNGTLYIDYIEDESKLKKLEPYEKEEGKE